MISSISNCKKKENNNKQTSHYTFLSRTKPDEIHSHTHTRAHRSSNKKKITQHGVLETLDCLLKEKKEKENHIYVYTTDRKKRGCFSFNTYQHQQINHVWNI